MLSAVPVLNGIGAVPGLWARCHGWYLRDKHGPLGYNAPFLHCNEQMEYKTQDAQGTQQV